MHILQQNLQTLCKERWRYFGVQGCRIKLWTKSVAVHMSGAVLCKKNFGQISENAVEQLQVPRNQRELTFATISLKERCTDWFTWCNSTVMMTNMKRNNILTTLSFWNYTILNMGSPPKKLYTVHIIIFTKSSGTPKLIFFWKLVSKSWDCERPFWLKLNHTTFPSCPWPAINDPCLN